MTSPGSTSAGGTPRLGAPVALQFSTVKAILNAELANHPVYDGFELQWFDDDVHGTGMLAFLSRREDQTFDYYADPALRVDPSWYSIGAGTHSWSTTEFDSARIEATEDGVVAQARFADLDGRVIEVDIDDRDGRLRRRAGFLAPVSAAVTDPRALFIVWMPAFDLVRLVPGRPPIIRIDGHDARVGALPGQRLHRRHLIKYASPVCTARFNADDDVLAGRLADAVVEPAPEGVRAVTAAADGHGVAVRFTPPLPDLTEPAGRAPSDGTWAIEMDDARVTGGTWSLRPADGERNSGGGGTGSGGGTELTLRLTQRWRPRRLPLLMRIVTTVLPVFRRWPTTYMWRGVVGSDGVVSKAGWSRTGGQDGTSYRRATRS